MADPYTPAVPGSTEDEQETNVGILNTTPVFQPTGEPIVAPPQEEPVSILGGAEGVGTYQEPESVSTNYLTPEAMVSNQMTSLLSANSPYLQQARNRAGEEANQLGLLSSSMAVGASERAAIESALPIASQDAQANMESQLLKQRGAQDIELTNIQGGISSRLQQEKSQQDLQTQAAQGDINSRIQLEKSNQDRITESLSQDAATSRTIMELESARDLTLAELEQADRAAYMETSGRIFQQYQDAYQSIQTTPDDILNANEKNKLLNYLNQQSQAQIQLSSDLIGIPLSWDSTGDISEPSSAGAAPTPTSTPSTIGPELPIETLTPEEQVDGRRMEYFIRDEMYKGNPDDTNFATKDYRPPRNGEVRGDMVWRQPRNASGGYWEPVGSKEFFG